MKPLLLTLALVLFGLSQASCGWTSSNTASPESASSPAVSNTATAANSQDEARDYFEQGKELYRKDRDREAVKAFQKAISLNPDFAEAYYRLGLALAVSGQKKEAEEAYQKAVEAYEKLIEQNPEDADAHFNMGQAYGKLGQYDDAIKAYKKAVKLKPDSGDMFYELGVAQSKVAHYAEAVAALEKATELDPDNYRAVEALDKAKDDHKRFQAILKRQEELLRRQEAAMKQQEEEDAASASPSPTVKPSP